MSKKMKYILRSVVGFVIGCLVFSIFSYTVFHRSAYATIAEMCLRVGNNGELETEQNARLWLEIRSSMEDKPYELNSKKYKNNAQLHEEYGSQIITFGDKESAEHTILYLHGGAYVDAITDFHMHFCDRMAGETDSYVIVPLYPLAPNHTYKDTYELLDNMYGELRKSSDLIIMGDSAGGGMALSYCEYLNEKGIEQPDRLIAFSPWVDISMTTSDYSEYQARDPIVEREGAVVMGEAWAGDLDTKDYRVSPYFGNLNGLTDITMFVGTREILYPDVVSFYENLRTEDVNAELIVGEGMNHIYPIYPFVPESIRARNMAFRIIRDNVIPKADIKE